MISSVWVRATYGARVCSTTRRFKLPDIGEDQSHRMMSGAVLSPRKGYYEGIRHWTERDRARSDHAQEGAHPVEKRESGDRIPGTVHHPTELQNRLRASERNGTRDRYRFPAYRRRSH